MKKKFMRNNEAHFILRNIKGRGILELPWPHVVHHFPFDSVHYDLSPDFIVAKTPPWILIKIQTGSSSRGISNSRWIVPLPHRQLWLVTCELRNYTVIIRQNKQTKKYIYIKKVIKWGIGVGRLNFSQARVVLLGGWIGIHVHGIWKNWKTSRGCKENEQ